MRIELVLDGSGVLHVRHEVTNTGPIARSNCRSSRVVLPVPATAHGDRWTSPGSWCRRTRLRSACRSGSAAGRGRTAAAGPRADSAYLTMAGTPGFGTGTARSGRFTWPGAATRCTWVEAHPDGTRVLGVRPNCSGRARSPSQQGASYRHPGVLAVHSTDRARRHRPTASTAAFGPGPTHPSTPRPVVLNTWEAVYFDHDLDRPDPTGRRRRRDSESSGSSWTTAGSAVVATTPRRWGTGPCRPTSGPTVSARWSTTSRASACSSGSGSSRR